jgi:hypothetical protein
VTRQIALSAVVLVIATLLLYPRVGNTVWVWLALAAIVYAIAATAMRRRR